MQGAGPRNHHRMQLSPLPQRRMACAQHRKAKRQFCNTCQELLCGDCVATTHATPDHYVSLAADVTEEHRAALVEVRCCDWLI
jgi:RNase P subunit RPR2